MLNRIPVMARLFAILAIAMMVPCIHAISAGEWRSARGFMYPAIGTLFAAVGLAVLLRPMNARETARHELFTLLLAWTLLPVFAAIPLVLLMPNIGQNGAWFEMVSAMTTTGGTVLSRPSEVPDAVHLWLS